MKKQKTIVSKIYKYRGIIIGSCVAVVAIGVGILMLYQYKDTHKTATGTNIAEPSTEVSYIGDADSEYGQQIQLNNTLGDVVYSKMSEKHIRLNDTTSIPIEDMNCETTVLSIGQVTNDSTIMSIVKDANSNMLYIKYTMTNKSGKSLTLNDLGRVSIMKADMSTTTCNVVMNTINGWSDDKSMTISNGQTAELIAYATVDWSDYNVLLYNSFGNVTKFVVE